MIFRDGNALYIASLVPVVSAVPVCAGFPIVRNWSCQETKFFV